MAVEPESAPVMKAGFYNKNSQLQEQVLYKSLALVEQVVKPAPLAASSFTILDCACAHGRNSSIAARHILAALRQRLQQQGKHCDQPMFVEFIHEDLPQNDFSTLLDTIHDPEDGYMHSSSRGSSSSALSSLSEDGPNQDCSRSSSSSSSSSGSSTMDGGSLSHGSSQQQLQVTASILGRSMYEQLVPEGSLDLVLAFTCLHFIPRKPVLPTDCILPYLSRCNGVRDAFKQEFLRGFSSFLRHRAAECTRGGSLVFHLPVLPSGTTAAAAAAAPPATATLVAVAQAMCSEGLLSQHDVSHMSTCDFLPAPEVVAGALEAASGQWRVASCSCHRVHHPAWARYAAGECSVQEVAQAYRGFVQAVLEPSFLAGLVTAGHSEAAAQALVGLLFERVEAAFAAAPQPIEQIYLHAWLVRT